MFRNVWSIAHVLMFLICYFKSSFKTPKTPASFAYTTPITVSSWCFLNHVRLLFNRSSEFGRRSLVVKSSLKGTFIAWMSFHRRILVGGCVTLLIEEKYGKTVRILLIRRSRRSPFKKRVNQSSGVGMACVGGLDFFSSILLFPTRINKHDH